MTELLQFIYTGEVNVKQAELQAFMGIAESLQIKGLATNSATTNQSKNSDTSNSSYSQFNANNAGGVQRNHNNQHQFSSGTNHSENNRQISSTPLSNVSSGETHQMKGDLTRTKYIKKINQI